VLKTPRNKVFSNWHVGGSRSPPPCPSCLGSPVNMKDVTEPLNVHGSRKLDPMTPKDAGYGPRKL
jgi:hypothetical protein